MMFNIQIVILTILLILVTNFFFKKQKILLDIPNFEKHKKFISKKKTPLSLGPVLIFLIFYFFTIKNSDYFNYLILLIFMIGLLSDIRILKSPLVRILLQITIIAIYLFLSENLIDDTRIIIINTFLKEKTFAIFFTLFCLIVLINGTNFIDGINGLVLSYYLIVLLTIILIFNNLSIETNQFFIFDLIPILSLFIIFNLLGKSFLGDSGAYSLSFVMGISLIEISNQFYEISPWLIVLLLWYPAIENLFSIIRRQSYNLKITKADNLHLHQLLFLIIKKKTRYNSLVVSGLTTFLINTYNFIIFFHCSFYYNNTQVLLLHLIVNSLVYVILYNFLSNYFKKTN